MRLYGKLTILCKCKTVIYMQVYYARLKLEIYAKNKAESYKFLANKKCKQCICRLVLLLPERRLNLSKYPQLKATAIYPLVKLTMQLNGASAPT